MAFRCGSCGAWVADNVGHVCLSFLGGALQPPPMPAWHPPCAVCGAAMADIPKHVAYHVEHDDVLSPNPSPPPDATEKKE